MDIDKRGIDPTAVNRPLGRPVFDIAHPRQATPSNMPMTPAHASKPMGQPTISSVDDTPPSSVPTGTVISPGATATAPSPQATSSQEKPKKQKRSKKPLVMLLATLLVISGAGGAYWFLAMRGDNTASVASTSKTEESPLDSVVTPATTIDGTLTEIESTLSSLNDTQDFDEAAFSDTTLGL